VVGQGDGHSGMHRHLSTVRLKNPCCCCCTCRLLLLCVVRQGDGHVVMHRHARRVGPLCNPLPFTAAAAAALCYMQAAGGHVWWDRVMGELAVSRAIGDHCLRPYVIPEPEVR
jgi:hypothetical protein